MTPSNGGAQAPGSAPAGQRQRASSGAGRGPGSRRRGPAPPRTADKKGRGGGRRNALRPLYDPSQPLTGRSLLAAAKALTRLEVAPQAAGLRRQIGDTNAQAQAAETRIGDYYRQLGALAGTSVTDQQATSDRTNAALKAITDQTQGTITAAGDDATARTQAMADRGLDGGAFARLAAETAAQRQVASQYGQAARTSGALQGGDYEGLTGTAAAIGASRGRESLSQVANAFARQNETPLAKLAELRGQRGALLTKNVGALREGERNYELARGTLGLNQAKAASDVASDAANRRLSLRKFSIETAMKDRQFRLDVQKLGLDVAKDKYQRDHGLGSYRPAASRRRSGGITTNQANGYYAEITKAKGVAQQLQRQGFGTGEIRQAMANGYYIVSLRNEDGTPRVDRNGVPMQQRYYVPRVDGGGTGAFANAAMDLVFRRGLSSANVRALHQLGLQNLRARYPVL